jgi:hypothetical protein
MDTDKISLQSNRCVSDESSPGGTWQEVKSGHAGPRLVSVCWSSYRPHRLDCLTSPCLQFSSPPALIWALPGPLHCNCQSTFLHSFCLLTHLEFFQNLLENRSYVFFTFVFLMSATQQVHSCHVFTEQVTFSRLVLWPNSGQWEWKLASGNAFWSRRQQRTWTLTLPSSSCLEVRCDTNSCLATKRP